MRFPKIDILQIEVLFFRFCLSCLTSKDSEILYILNDLQKSIQLAYSLRWTGLLAIAAHRACSASLLELPVDEAGFDEEPPFLEDVLH